MVRNLKKNMPAVIDSYAVSSLFGAAAGIPAVMVGAGPGLDSTISYVRKYRDRALLFAVDSACLPLHAEGIAPDFVVCVDPKEETALNFTGIPRIENIIVLPTVFHEAIDMKPSRLFCTVQEKGLVQDICGHRLDSKGLTQAGGSVSCIMFDIVARMGCRPVILAGIDYSFPGWKFYATHTPEYKKILSGVSRFSPLETISYHCIREQKLMFLPNAGGAPVPTYQSLYSYARSMEQLIRSHKEAEVYSLFSEGVHLQGTKNLFFEEELEALLPGSVDKQGLLARAGRGVVSAEDREALLEISRRDTRDILEQVV
jgi:hypothetical protein